MLFDPSTGKVTPFLTRRNLERFKGPNDLIIDSKNNIYFTDQGQTGMTDQTGKVYRLTPEGRLDCLVEKEFHQTASYFLSTSASSTLP